MVLAPTEVEPRVDAANSAASVAAAGAHAPAYRPGHQENEHASALPTRRFYRPELDAMRLLAFLMVWTSHSLPSSSEAAAHHISPTLLWWIEAVKDAGNFGVCVFFFLSAYLITELLRREREVSGTIDLRAFYIRRILRIWPLYLGVLAAYGVLGLRFHGFRIEPGRLLCSLLMAGNWYIALHPAILTPMRALWSLSVEEQFYVAWPVLARRLTLSGMVAVCLALCALAAGTLGGLGHHAAGQPMLHVTAWVNSLVQFQFFALGALAALVLRGREVQLGVWPRAALLFAALASMLLAAGACGIKRPLPWHSTSSLLSGYLLAGLGCTLLFAAVLGMPARAVPRWAVTLGQVSFGLYVFHETGFFFADTLQKHLVPSILSAAPMPGNWALWLAANKAVSLVFTIVLALVSYHFWERPFLRFKDRFTVVQSRRA